MRKARFFDTSEQLTKPKPTGGMLNQMNLANPVTFELDTKPQRRTLEFIPKKQKKKNPKDEKNLLTWQQDKFEEIIVPKNIDQTIIVQKNESGVNKKETQLENIIKEFEVESAKLQNSKDLVPSDLPKENEKLSIPEKSTELVKVMAQTIQEKTEAISLEEKSKEEGGKNVVVEENLISTLSLFSTNNETGSLYNLFSK
jgi:hypothetical protein